VKSTPFTMTVSIAIVTGSNKGLGYGIVQSLAEKLPADKWHIYLTSRDVSRGQEALKKLHDSGLSHVHFHQLDVTDEASVVALKKFIQDKYPNGINILVNNAGLLFPQDSALLRPIEKTFPFKEVLETTMKTNFWSIITVHKHLAPLLAKNARVVNVSSLGGIWMMKKLEGSVRDQLLAIKSCEQLEAFVKKYEKAALAKAEQDSGNQKGVYGMSKLCLTALTKFQAQELENDSRDIVINSCCPGYVATDLNGFRGLKTIQEGIETPIYLALLPEKNIRGQFVTNLEVYDWETAHLNDKYNPIDLNAIKEDK